MSKFADLASSLSEHSAQLMTRVSADLLKHTKEREQKLANMMLDIAIDVPTRMHNQSREHIADYVNDRLQTAGFDMKVK